MTTARRDAAPRLDAPIALRRLRLTNQGLAGTGAGDPADIARRMGAIQAQDYLASLWAVGVRCRRAREADVERALANRSIVRTWLLRGTLQMVTAEDLRWMLAVVAPRAIAAAATRLRQLRIDDESVAAAAKVVRRVLAHGPSTRPALFRRLENAGIATSGQRGVHILWRLAYDGVLCFGARDGKQQTFVLLDDWVPGAKPVARDRALRELARRYFASHGPATQRDFVWWSGLAAADARAAMDGIGSDLVGERVGGRETWRAKKAAVAHRPRPIAHLLPAFDEYLVGYASRDDILDPARARQVNAGGGMLNPTILVDGVVAGVWKRTLRKSTAVVEIRWFMEPTEQQWTLVAAAATKYSTFLGLDAQLATKRTAAST